MEETNSARTRSRKLTLAVCCLQIFLTGGIFMNFTLFTDFLLDRGLTSGDVSNIGNGIWLSFGLAMLPYGYLFDRNCFSSAKTRNRVFMLAAVTPGIAGCLIAGLLRVTVPAFYTGFFLVGASCGFLFNIINSFVSINFRDSQKQKDMAFATISVTYALGSVAYSALLPIVIREVGARLVFGLFASQFALCFVLVFCQSTLDEEAEQVEVKRIEEALDAKPQATSFDAQAEGPTSFCSRFRDTLTLPKSLLVFLVYGISTSITYAFLPSLGILAETIFSTDKELQNQALVNTMFMVFGVCTRIVSIFLAWHPMYQGGILVVSTLFSVVAGALLLTTPTLFGLLFSGVLISIALSGIGGIVSTFASTYFPHGKTHFSESIAVLECTTAVGAFLVGLVYSCIFDHTDISPIVFVSATLLLLGSFTIVLACLFLFTVRSRGALVEK